MSTETNNKQQNSYQFKDIEGYGCNTLSLQRNGKNVANIQYNEDSSSIFPDRRQAEEMLKDRI